MSGRNRWSDLRAEAQEGTRERAARKTDAMLGEMPLHELRQARRPSQDKELGASEIGAEP